MIIVPYYFVCRAPDFDIVFYSKSHYTRSIRSNSEMYNMNFSDRFHFDNPVYSFGQTSSLVGTVDENQSFNNCQIKNNLQKPNNLIKASCSSSMAMDDSDSSCMPSTSSSSFKNREADMNNPNIYNSLDDLKSENLYDEIEDKKLAAAGKVLLLNLMKYTF